MNYFYEGNGTVQKLSVRKVEKMGKVIGIALIFIAVQVIAVLLEEYLIPYIVFLIRIVTGGGAPIWSLVIISLIAAASLYMFISKVADRVVEDKVRNTVDDFMESKAFFRRHKKIGTAIRGFGYGAGKSYADIMYGETIFRVKLAVMILAIAAPLAIRFIIF
ncbi:MAG: hypothetical protein LUD12_06985 [Lachnospiraceae bacterium]|nr:hypothetical protein [Lachnospiraceae bacterium]